MESRLTSSAKISLELQHWTLSSKCIKIRKQNASHPRISVIESSSCPCSTTLFWTRKEMKIFALPLRGKSKSTPQDTMTNAGHSWDLVKKVSGIKDLQSIVAANGSSCFANGGRFGEFRTPSFPKGKSAWSWNIEKENNRNTVHFSGEYDNIDMLYRTVHSANQLCFYGAVTKWCGKQSRADSGEVNQSWPESARRSPREILIK